MWMYRVWKTDFKHLNINPSSLITLFYNVFFQFKETSSLVIVFTGLCLVLRLNNRRKHNKCSLKSPLRKKVQIMLTCFTHPQKQTEEKSERAKFQSKWSWPCCFPDQLSTVHKLEVNNGSVTVTKQNMW